MDLVRQAFRRSSNTSVLIRVSSILEGVLTCVVAIAFFFVLPNFPEDAKWLTEEERAYVTSRLAADQGKTAIERPISFKDVGMAFKDFKMFLGG